MNAAQSLGFDLMEEKDFTTFFKGIIAWIGDQYADVMLGDVRDEYWQMLNSRLKRGAAAWG